MKNSKKSAATPVVEIPSYETIIGILAPTVENNDPFEMELFQDIHAKTGFAYENLEQDSKKLVFEFRNADQILFITFKFKGIKLVATWKFDKLVAEIEECQLANRRETARIEKRQEEEIEADTVENSLPTIEELEERINDLPSKKGRGYANAGKKYDHSGVRVDEFKLGKAKVKKGDKLYFKVGKAEVCGIFSHLNKCVHCPEGYAVIRFEGKNFERRQSRVSLSASVAE